LDPVAFGGVMFVLLLVAWTAAQWLRFMVIHNHHHQKIIPDVLAAAD